MSKGLDTYFDKKMNIEISASSVLLVRVLNSTSFDEINTLNEIVMLETKALELLREAMKTSFYLPFPCVYIYIK